MMQRHEVFHCRKTRPPRPEKYFRHLTQDAFRRMLGHYRYDIPEKKNCPRFDQIAEFWAECKLHSLTERTIREIQELGGDLENVKYPWPEKGLFIYGPCGSGKTSIAKVLLGSLKTLRLTACFITTFDMVNRFMAHGELWFVPWMEQVEETILIVDDFGSERIAKRYGSESIMNDFIAYRSESWERYRTPTIFTSNLVPYTRGVSADEISRDYGERISSRITGMCQTVLMNGQDRRQA